MPNQYYDWCWLTRRYSSSKIIWFTSSEELQYDSGVDVNSVGSCDSTVQSPKTTDEFDLEEAVNYLIKGKHESI